MGSIWLSDNNLTVLPHWNHGECIGQLSPNGRILQISEILQFTQMVNNA